MGRSWLTLMKALEERLIEEMIQKNLSAIGVMADKVSLVI